MLKSNCDLGYRRHFVHGCWIIWNAATHRLNVSGFDPRDPRKTAESIVREYASNWQSLRNTSGDPDKFAFLLPFAHLVQGITAALITST